MIVHLANVRARSTRQWIGCQADASLQAKLNVFIFAVSKSKTVRCSKSSEIYGLLNCENVLWATKYHWLTEDRTTKYHNAYIKQWRYKPYDVKNVIFDCLMHYRTVTTVQERYTRLSCALLLGCQWIVLRFGTLYLIVSCVITLSPDHEQVSILRTGNLDFYRQMLLAKWQLLKEGETDNSLWYYGFVPNMMGPIDYFAQKINILYSIFNS
jgi:hypothetical protein